MVRLLLKWLSLNTFKRRKRRLENMRSWQVLSFHLLKSSSQALVRRQVSFKKIIKPFLNLSKLL